MALGPILSRELLVAARSPKTYSTRVFLTIGFLLAFCGIYEGYRYYYEGKLSVQQVSSLARQTFLIFVAIQGIATLIIVPNLVCGAIAREKDGKTLGFLLGTPLGSAEIVLGKLASRLIHYFASIAVGVPILLLLMLLGGIEPIEVGLVYAATLSTALALGAFAIFASTLGGGTKQAAKIYRYFIALWIIPIGFSIFGRFLTPRLYQIVEPVVGWLLASSPFFFFRYFPTIILTRAGIDWFGEILLMIELQLGLCVVFVTLAIWRLRPTYRGQEGNERRSLRDRIRSWRWRIFPRPAVGDDPILWREKYAIETNGVVKLFGLVLGLTMLALFVYFTLQLGLSALQETWRPLNDPNYTPNQWRFSIYIRILSASIGSLVVLMLSAAVATSVSSEKERDTWLGVITTPLSGREILGAKRRAALFRPRAVLIAILVLWPIGVICQSLHPIGLLIALAVLAAWTTLTLGLGSYFSTRIALSGNASGAPAGILVLLWIVPPLINTYEPFRSTFWGVSCLPYLLALALVPNQGVELIRSGMDQSSFSSLLLFDNSGWVRGAITLFLGIVIPAVAGFFLIRYADRSFDRVTGRPTRPGSA